MEPLSRSSHRRKHSTAANVFSSSFSFKNPYGDVLLSNGSERKSLQVHEYSEIFSGSSSIPVLDLSAMDERVGSGDFLSSKLDYTNIFSGLTHDDVFVPYEELLSGSAKRAKPREGQPHLQESSSRCSSRKTERSPAVTSDQSVDRVKLQESGSLPSTIKMERPSGMASDPSVDRDKLQESRSLPSTIKMERPSGMTSDPSVDRDKLQESGSLPSTVKMERPSGVASDPSFDGGKMQESGSLRPSRKAERPSGVASDQSTDGIEQQFNMSFNRTNQINTDASDAKTHIAELHAVPGFTQFVDGSRLQKGKNDRPPLPKREVSRTWSFSAEFEPVNAKGGSSFEKSRVLDKSHNASEVHLKPPLPDAPKPSTYPTNLSDNKSRASNFASKGDVSQKIAGESSEDFDDNSVDAVSAAALKKAIEQAQESIRIAKIIMERKKDSYQDGSKVKPISCLKVADRETKTDHEAFGSKNNNTRKKYEELDPLFPAPAEIDGKLTPPLSHGGTCFHAESSEGERVSENVETDRELGETFAGGSKLFASNHIQTETTNVDENVKVEKLVKTVDADEVQREGNNFHGCGAVDLDAAEAGKFNSLVPPMSEVASNLGRLETDTETFNWRKVRSEVVHELVERSLDTSQRTRGKEKSWEEDEFCQATSIHAEVSKNNGGRVLSNPQRISEHDKAVDEASENLRNCPEDGVSKQRENDREDKKQHEKKLEECDAMANTRSESNDTLNESRNLVRNESLDQQEVDRKTESVSEWEGGDQSHGETYNEEIEQKEGHQLVDNKEQLKEVLLEVINEGKHDIFPELREFTIKVDGAHQPHINDDKQDFADHGDEPELLEELVRNQVEKEQVNIFKYEAVRTNMMEASHYTNVQKRETFREAEKTGNTERGAGRGEGQEAAYEDDTDEAVNLSSGEASIIFDVTHTNGTSNTIAETQESCHVVSNSKTEEHQKSVKNSEEDVPKSNGAVSALDEDKMEEGLFNLLDDEMLRTNYLHRSASEEIFMENKLHDAYEGLPSDSRTEAVDVMDANPKENLSQDEDVSETTSDMHAAEINRQDIPQVLESHFRKVELDFPDVEQVLEQTAESDEGSISDSSFEKIDEMSAQNSKECAENVKGVTSNREELSDDMISDERKCAEELSEGLYSQLHESDGMISDERKCAEELSEGLYSQLHDEPKEMDKPLETEEAVDTDMNGEKDKENIVGTSSSEETDAKEGMQNFESNDQQQRIEAIKKGREREKDRIAVERAIREARERAFAEVRERAERAAVERAATEVRQRVAEAREKVEKPSVAKQPLDKASSEAKLRAERAAVERATAEARERALEKAKSLKTSEELKMPADKHSTGRFSSSSRNNVLKHSFSSSDLETGTNSESAQRRKARLERHQRIMERAAKALAEKNMRDLLAQKEQDERNRLAESLDADIKRWASGKEGNLRALLSTLQYILGPESGWQSISLTEIITTAAVKKAYRKATLCVHPDKLQQRGASVQQKYICEKVFDLLKAAWNRFNSDER